MVIFHALSSYVNVYQRVSLFIAISECQTLRGHQQKPVRFTQGTFGNDPFHHYSYGPLPVISTYNPIYRMYNPTYNKL